MSVGAGGFHQPPVAQDRHVVTDLQQLVQLVRDIWMIEPPRLFQIVDGAEGTSRDCSKADVGSSMIRAPNVTAKALASRQSAAGRCAIADLFVGSMFCSNRYLATFHRAFCF